VLLKDEKMPVSSVYRPDPQFERLGDSFSDPVKAADFPQTILRYRNEHGPLAWMAWVAWMSMSGLTILGVSRRCLKTCRIRGRCGTTAISFARTILTLVMVEVSCLRNFVTIKIWNKGLRTNAVFTSRGWSTDVERRRSGGSRCGAVGSPRRQDVEGI